MRRSRSWTDPAPLAAGHPGNVALKELLLGAIARAHGVQGELQVVPFHADSDFWAEGTELHRIPHDALTEAERWRGDVVEVDDVATHRVEALRSGPKGRLLLRLAGVSGREAAERIRGHLLAVPPEWLEEPGEDAFWYHEVPGWRVETPDGTRVGEVVRAVPLPTEVLEVRPADRGDTFFVPLVGDVVRAIDRDGRRIVVDQVESLRP